MRMPRVAGVVGALPLLVWGTSSPASATGFGPCCGGYYYADNGGHSFYYDMANLTSSDRTVTDWARANSLDGQTDMSTSVNSSYNTQVDVYVTDDYDAGVNAIAITYCVYFVSSDKCDQFHVVYNEVYHSQYHTRHVACHEIGHTTGLGDDSPYDGCMAATGDYFGAHDRSHINSRY